MRKALVIVVWTAIALLGAGALASIAFTRGEPVSAIWFVLAAGCTDVGAYRSDSAFLAVRVRGLDDTRAPPAERLDDGRDFCPTNKWVVIGHHFAAIAGPGPLVGPTLAAQFGYLPGTLWLILGAVLGGCVQDFVILFCSLRRNGKSLGQMAREEVSRRGGTIAIVSVLAIMIILLAVVALVVVNALKDSPWAASTLFMTIPIAMLMGVYMRFWRPGRVLEASILGFALVLLAVVAGQWVAAAPQWATVFSLSGPALAVAVIIYGFAASALPVWLLLAPRDYLSAFIKVGAILALAGGILIVRPAILMPPLTRFVDGTGPVFAGKIFPFCFITIACGWVSARCSTAPGARPRSRWEWPRSSAAPSEATICSASGITSPSCSRRSSSSPSSTRARGWGASWCRSFSGTSTRRWGGRAGTRACWSRAASSSGDGATSSTRGCAIRWAASTRSGRSSGSPTSSCPPWPWWSRPRS